MSKSIEEEVQEVLHQSADQVNFEEPLGSEGSPLNQPVVENEIGHTDSAPATESNEVEEQPDSEKAAEDVLEEVQNEKPDFDFDGDGQDDGIPEQEIGTGEYQERVEEELAGDDFELPSSHARQAADTILGMTDNVLAVGGGFFIKIKKHKEFYDFEEVIQVIDEQNEKNIKRLKLDEEDKILLRPLLITMLKRKAKKLTPEQQLLGAVLSILMKKAQVVMEIRAENEILVERILDVIREERGYTEQNDEVEAPEYQEDQQKETVQQEEKHEPPASHAQEEFVEEVIIGGEDHQEQLNSTLEVAEEVVQEENIEPDQEE